MPEAKASVISPTISGRKRVSRTPAIPKSAHATPTPIRPSAPKLSKTTKEEEEEESEFHSLGDDFVWDEYDWNPELAKSEELSREEFGSALKSIHEELERLDNDDDDPYNLKNIKKKLQLDDQKPEEPQPEETKPFIPSVPWYIKKPTNQPIIVLRPEEKGIKPIYIRGYAGAHEVYGPITGKSVQPGSKPYPQAMMSSTFKKRWDGTNCWQKILG